VSECLRFSRAVAEVFERAAVSMPITWEELRHEPSRWTLRTTDRRLASRGRDPRAAYWKGAQTLARSSIGALDAMLES
jgi:DNA primase